MRRRYSTQNRFAVSGRWFRRGARSWGGVVAVAVACSLLASSARAAAPTAQQAQDGAAGWLLHANTPTPLDQLEARVAELSKQYRGQLDVLTGAETAAEAATARVLLLNRQLAAAHRQLARLAAASLASWRCTAASWRFSSSTRAAAASAAVIAPVSTSS